MDIECLVNWDIGMLSSPHIHTFTQLMKQVKELHIDTEERVVNLIFEKAIDEPNLSVGYGIMCKSLAAASNRERLQDELEEAKNKACRKTKGNVKFIEDLFKLRMLPESIIHNRVVKLLKQNDEESLECLSILLTTAGKEMDFKKAKEKRTPETEEKDILVQMVQELEATLAYEQKDREQEINERNATHLQNITKLLSSLKLHEEKEKIVERQVAQLEAVLKYERNYWEKKRKKVKRVMKTSNNLQLKTTKALQDSLNHSEEKKCADHESDHLRSDRERLEQRLAQLEATLNFDQNKFEKEKEMIKLDIEEMTTRHFQTIRELQDSLNHCEDEKIYLMRDRERLEERVAQLEATLKFVQNKFEKETEKAKPGMDERIPLQRQTTRELQDSLIHCEEEKKIAKHERNNLMRDRE
ncbi:eukaryotic translation initiation factor 4 gamma 1 isoform X1 [Silurus meridionalis]|nr:eukaryotic translation initiation factor 4 gamma 1 isoform X1 [Silurus meridionalis]